MKNNKGFSLVELIIVIAIMAILVGVMAPQLIKYIEKTNVSADVQLCDSIREAVQTAMMDPSVISVSGTNPQQGIPAAGTINSAEFKKSGTAGYTAFSDAVYEILGTEDPKTQIKSSAKSVSGTVIKYKVGTNSVLVWITNSDNSGKKSVYTAFGTNGNPGVIEAGDQSLRPTAP